MITDRQGVRDIAREVGERGFTALKTNIWRYEPDGRIARWAVGFGTPFSPELNVDRNVLKGLRKHLRIMEVDIDRIAWDHELFTHVPEYVDGHLVLPDRPGWGTEPNEEAMGRYPPIAVHGLSSRMRLILKVARRLGLAPRQHVNLSLTVAKLRQQLGVMLTQLGRRQSYARPFAGHRQRQQNGLCLATVR